MLTLGRINKGDQELATKFSILTNADTGVYPQISNRTEAGQEIRQIVSAAHTQAKESAEALAKNLNINNIVGNHKTLWATKRMNSTKFIDRKVEVDGKLMDNKVSFEGDMRITKFLPEAFNKAKNRTVSHVSGENAASYISKLNNLKSIYEGIPNPIRGEKAPRILMSKDKGKQNENIKIYNKAIEIGRLTNKKSRGMSTFDFD